jgi:purine nucleosidase
MEENFSECWIIDTDYTLDDQLAISYLIKHLNVVAITVNAANTGYTPEVIKAKIEDDLVNKHGNTNIKVYPGCDRPFIDYVKDLKDDPIFNPYNFKQVDFKESESTAKLNKNESIPEKLSNLAAVKIAEHIRVYEKKLNIITLGPLTNIALAAIIDSAISSMFNKLYVVGGSYNNQGNSGSSAEYNFRADPVAAKNVVFYFNNVVLVPYELEIQLIKEKKLSKISYPIFNEFIEQLYSQEEPEDTRCMPSMLGFIASIVICHNDIIKKTEKRTTEVDISGKFTRGALAIAKYVHIRMSQANTIEIIEEIDSEKFSKWFSLI